MMAASLCISSLEALHLDLLFDNCPIIGLEAYTESDHAMTDGLSSAIRERHISGQFRVSIGATDAYPNDILFPDLLDETMASLGHLDLDEFFEFMVSSANAVSTRGVSAEQLSKVWSIDMSDAQRTIDATTQLCVRSKGDALTRNYTTNDRMLRYRRIKQHFFKYTVFATKQSNHPCVVTHACNCLSLKKGLSMLFLCRPSLMFPKH